MILTTFAAYLDFYHHPSVDKIFIGDPTICQLSAKQFAYFKDGTISLEHIAFTDDKRIMDRLNKFKRIVSMQQGM